MEGSCSLCHSTLSWLSVPSRCSAILILYDRCMLCTVVDVDAQLTVALFKLLQTVDMDVWPPVVLVMSIQMNVCWVMLSCTLHGVYC